MLHPALVPGQSAALYRVRTYAAGMPLLSFWARGIAAALSRAAWLAPRYECVEVHGDGGYVVASWRNGVPDSADPLAAWPDHMVRDARAAWPEATDEQLRSVLILAEHYGSQGGRWLFDVAVAAATVRAEQRGIA